MTTNQGEGSGAVRPRAKRIQRTSAGTPRIQIHAPDFRARKFLGLDNQRFYRHDIFPCADSVARRPHGKYRSRYGLNREPLFWRISAVGTELLA